MAANANYLWPLLFCQPIIDVCFGILFQCFTHYAYPFCIITNKIINNKLYFFLENNEDLEVTLRGCVPVTFNCTTDIPGGISAEKCDICNSDKCNSASATPINMATLGWLVLSWAILFVLKDPY